MITVIGNAQIVLEDCILHDSSIVIKDGTILTMGKTNVTADKFIDAKGGFVFPGFIDLHLHGGDTFDFRDASDIGFRRIGAYHALHGTTSYLVTIGSHPLDKLLELLSQTARFMKNAEDDKGSQIMGIHLEGPFIAREYAGNMKQENILPPSTEMMQQFIEAAEETIRIVTLAPELPGAADVIRILTQHQIVASAGHTGATYQEMERAIRQGIKHVTHIYNAMRGFHHREPAAMTSALLNKNVTAEYIGDFIHSHPAAAELLIRVKGCDRIALITDASRHAGVKTGALRNADGNLAGSSISMDSALRNVITEFGLQPWEAATMASLTPARVIGIDHCKGSIREGKDADLVITDSDFRVLATMIKGKLAASKID